MRLELELMGTPQLRLDDQPVSAGRRAVVALLAYLAVNHVEHPQARHTRDTLSALLWSDYLESKALTNLRHTLWEVTKLIGEGWIVAEHETLFLRTSADLKLDVEQFRSLFTQASQESQPARRIALLTAAVKLYRGDFLSGFSLKNAAGFNEWILLKSDELRREMTSALGRLVEDYSTTGKAELAIPHVQRLITMDRFDEAAHRQLMQVYVLTDQPAAAIQHYQTLEKLLRKELNLDPQPETRDLYRKIRKGEIRPSDAELPLPLHNLPLPLTAFIGRNKQQGEVSNLLLQHRLVTLIGTGGIGKTRLALQTGAHMQPQFQDGVWFIPLESLVDEKLLVQTTASALGISRSSNRLILDTLLEALRARTILLILDNCEHLLEPCAQLVESLLKACPNLKVLATSRHSLDVEGEASYSVPSLAIPRKTDLRSVDDLAQIESVHLFAERAALINPDFEVTQENARPILDICRRLDGLPLAIELAAARVDLFSVEEIRDQLARSFDLLVSSQRSLSQRHRTLRASIDWSWNLLTDSDHTFLRHLAVFAGGWTFGAAQAICDCGSLELTSALVRKSLLVVHQEAGRETRYDFHQMIREYAWEKLMEAGEDTAIRDRHLDYYLDFSRRFEPALQGHDQLVWLERLYLERDNIRTALRWAAQTNVQAGLYLSERLRLFWENYALEGEKRWLLMI